MKYIAIDVGSSFIKTSLFDMKKCVIIEKRKIASPQKLENKDKNIFEISAELLFNTVKEIIDGMSEKYEDIEGVVFSTQMHGFVYDSNCEVNKEDIYVSWQDNRCLNIIENEGRSYIEELKELFSKEEMADCGVYIKPSLGLSNLYTMLYEIDNQKRTGKLYTLGSYFISRLTGNNICHITNAAPLGFCDVVNKKWNEKIIKKAGFENIVLPVIAKSDFEVCGIYKSNGQELKIYPDYGDHQISILGSMAGKNDVVINIATASQVSNTTEHFMPGEYETRPFFEGRYMNTISNMPSGRNLDVLIDFIKDTTHIITGISVDTNEIWNSVLKDFKYDLDGLTADVGFYSTPYNMNGGKIGGITYSNFNLNTLFSAAFYNMADVYDKNIKGLCGNNIKVEKLVFSGGVSWRIPKLLEIVSQKTGYPYCHSAIPDEAFSGLFRIALVCAGICTDLNDKKELTLKLK
ncbi:MAG: FGGY family carbohydrate kinase [Sedimentibacter sp.]|uniref:sedoheptulokinase n=1 Tax=Sedimentibacter sp. TaxID=1960295 RepID=UPI00315960CC